MASDDDDKDVPRNWRRRLFPAVPMAVVYALVLCLLAEAIDWEVGGGGAMMLVVAFLFGVPAAATSVAVMIADPRGQMRGGRHALIGFYVTSVFLFAAVVLLREGGICVIMAAPLFYLASIVGGLITGLLLRRTRGRATALVLVLAPVLGMPLEAGTSYPERTGSVITVVEIAAPPEAVWRNTVAIPDIRPRELSWTFSHAIVGVPRPEDARLEGEGVGAVRYLHWGGGIHFQEWITAWDLNRSLAWTFHFAPDSIPAAVEGHIRVNSPYLKLTGGHYTLDPLPGGRTRLTLQTDYWIATPINAYCAWWGDVFLTDFHRIVLGVIKERSERAASL
ncbi:MULTISPECIES: hypothetical protein [Inquilinus]|uniref:SRPBCC family protein n=1 Tax=Inquilinus ginsengisoli TaxID=363840 RepID=A0ABU1JMR4_9PROT|nr:hypothetical protein [Inquilinus ginsengisoli]MDR6289895.1 hypothetical protein [Inquilinus ginsengisoli]